MTTELQAVATFGWFPEATVTDELEPIGTFGWYLETGITPPVEVDEILNFLLCVTREYNFLFER